MIFDENPLDSYYENFDWYIDNLNNKYSSYEDNILYVSESYTTSDGYINNFCEAMRSLRDKIIAFFRNVIESIKRAFLTASAKHELKVYDAEIKRVIKDHKDVSTIKVGLPNADEVNKYVDGYIKRIDSLEDTFKSALSKAIKKNSNPEEVRSIISSFKEQSNAIGNEFEDYFRSAEKHGSTMASAEKRVNFTNGGKKFAMIAVSITAVITTLSLIVHKIINTAEKDQEFINELLSSEKLKTDAKKIASDIVKQSRENGKELSDKDVGDIYKNCVNVLGQERVKKARMYQKKTNAFYSSIQSSFKSLKSIITKISSQGKVDPSDDVLKDKDFQKVKADENQRLKNIDDRFNSGGVK